MIEANGSAPTSETLPLNLVDVVCVEALTGNWDNLHSLPREDQIAIYEAAHYYDVNVDATGVKPELPTSQVAARLWQHGSLPDILLAIRALDGRRTSRERNAGRAAGAVGVTATVLEVPLVVTGAILDRTHLPFVANLANVPAAGVRGLASLARQASARGSSLLHNVISELVRLRHGVKYINNPNTRLDEDSLKAWMAAWALEKVYAYNGKGELDPDLSVVSRRIAAEIPSIHDRTRRIIVGLGGSKASDVPAGIELLELRRALGLGTPFEIAVPAFTKRTTGRASERAHTLEKIGPPPSTKPKGEAYQAIAESSRLFAYDSLMTPDELATQLKRAIYAFTDSETSEERARASELLARTAVIIKERWQAAPPAGQSERQAHRAQFGKIFVNEILGSENPDYFENLMTCVSLQIGAIQDGSAPVGILRLADSFSREHEIWELHPDRWTAAVEKALINGAHHWHSLKSPLLDESKTPPLVVSPRSLTGMARMVAETHVRTYLLDATVLSSGMMYPEHLEFHASQVLRDLPKKGSRPRATLEMALTAKERALLNESEANAR